MKVLLTGATGFTGSSVFHELRRRGVGVRIYARDGIKATALAGKEAEICIGDLGDRPGFTSACEGCDVLINVASIGFGHASTIVKAAEDGGIIRTIFVSTTAIFTQLNAASKAVRTAAEAQIRNSKLRWTILRPTMIYGSDRDRNICRLIRAIRRYPILPVFGSGDYLMQPVYVADLAFAIVNAANSAVAENKEYNVSGREPLTYNELVHTVARQLGRKIRLVHFPAKPAVKVLRGMERMGVRLPIKAEQIERLNEHKAFSWEQAGCDLGFAPRTFAEGVALEIASLRFK